MHDRWQGWLSAPQPEVPDGGGAWVDLSHPLCADLSKIAYFPAPRFERIRSMPADPLNLTEIRMVCHFGTHVDAPIHFIPDGPAFHEIPLERLYGPGVVWRIPCEPYATIEREHLAGQRPALRPGDILLLDTGWGGRCGTDVYDRHPALSVAAAEWLVEQGVKLLAVDFATPDMAVNRRPEGFDWPVHHVLLSRGVLIAENVTNVAGLAGQRVDVMFLAINVEGADGAPARVVARPSSG